MSKKQQTTDLMHGNNLPIINKSKNVYRIK